MLESLLHLITPSIPLTYLLLDGHFGNHNALHMAQQCRVQLISKLRSDAALYVPYEGSYAGRGHVASMAASWIYRNIPDMYLKATTVEGPIQTRLYQAPLLHKEFPQALNVVILVKTTCRHMPRRMSSSSAATRAPLQPAQGLLCLRFQIEFNFRDAKQYWGLEDFMNITETAVTNAAHLSLFMVNVSYHFLRDVRQSDPVCSLLDLKARFRADKYVTETIKMLPEKPEPVLLAQIFTKDSWHRPYSCWTTVRHPCVIGEGIVFYYPVFTATSQPEVIHRHIPSRLPANSGLFWYMRQRSSASLTG